jgi:hypothetical protein
VTSQWKRDACRMLAVERTLQRGNLNVRVIAERAVGEFTGTSSRRRKFLCQLEGPALFLVGVVTSASPTIIDPASRARRSRVLRRRDRVRIRLVR